MFGHADGVVRFVDGGTVRVNDYREFDPDDRAALPQTLGPAVLEVVEVPYRPPSRRSRGIPPATGNDVNFPRVRGLVVLKAHGRADDELAYRAIRECFPGAAARVLECVDLAANGGVLNCATWSILARDGPPAAEVGA